MIILTSTTYFEVTPLTLNNVPKVVNRHGMIARQICLELTAQECVAFFFGRVLGLKFFGRDFDSLLHFYPLIVVL